MPKLIPVADPLSKPFWDAVNQRRLVLQHCASCDRLQYPPQQACQVCNSATGLTWKEVAGRGHIATSIVIEDGRLNRRMPDQPYNLAMVTLDADIRVNFYSNLPGTPPYKAPVGAAVEGNVRGGGPRPAHPRVAGRRLANPEFGVVREVIARCQKEPETSAGESKEWRLLQSTPFLLTADRL